VIVHGHDVSGKMAADGISLHDSLNNSRKTVASLPSARGRVAVATINNNATAVIGGSTQGGSMGNAAVHHMALVELGQVELSKVKKPSIIDFYNERICALFYFTF